MYLKLEEKCAFIQLKLEQCIFMQLKLEENCLLLSLGHIFIQLKSKEQFFIQLKFGREFFYTIPQTYFTELKFEENYYLPLMMHFHPSGTGRTMRFYITEIERKKPFIIPHDTVLSN